MDDFTMSHYCSDNSYVEYKIESGTIKPSLIELKEKQDT